MDYSLEQTILDSYFINGYRKRLGYELRNINKRKRVLHSLCHNYASIIKPEALNLIVSSDATAIAKIILQQGGSKERCYVMSLIANFDGVYVTLDDALESVVGNGMAALIYCNNGIAYFEAEQEQGPPPRFILKSY